MKPRLSSWLKKRPDRRFAIHGDNIVECERTLELITKAASASASGPVGSAAVPEFFLDTPTLERWLIRLFPGFGRWKPDILGFLRKTGGVIREAPDAIVTEIAHDSEQLLFAVEYSSALDAGNQAWQRNGRAYSLARAGVPYLYVTEIGGQELDSERRRKAVRVPNPAVPFSYASYSRLGGIPSLPVFVASPIEAAGAPSGVRDVYGRDEALRFVSCLLAKKDCRRSVIRLLDKTMVLVRRLADNRTRRDSLTSEQWDTALNVVADTGDLVHYLATAIKMPWRKTATIAALTPSAAALMRIASDLGVGLTSSNLPLCIVPSHSRKQFAEAVGRVHPRLPSAFATWLARRDHLVIAWVMGFKPRGDDARPDRGLPPLARMLVGDRGDMLTVVYGPAKRRTWPTLHDNPRRLMEQNGLWEVILELSDAVLIDSQTHQGNTDIAYLRSHWQTRTSIQAVQEPTPILVAPNPTKFTENDVDTALHMTFGRHLQPKSFEGLCNPPGGDWSGLSVLDAGSETEYRWLSLPRVSGHDRKRPDHVFQLQRVKHPPLLMIIESKEHPARLSANIGPRLIAYVQHLLASPPSVQRSHPNGPWFDSGGLFSHHSFAYCSAVAFLGPSPPMFSSFCKKTRADLVIEAHFDRSGRTCRLVLLPCTRRGEEAKVMIRAQQSHELYPIQ